MILTDRLPGLWPVPTQKHLKHQLRRFKLRQQKKMRAALRRIKSRLTAFSRKQYFISHGVRDAANASVANQDRVISTVLLSTILIYGLVMTASQFLYTFFLTAYQFAELSGISLAWLLLAAGGVIGTISLWIVSFVGNSLALSIQGGLDRHKSLSSLKQFRLALNKTTRTGIAWILLAAVSLGPVALGGIAGYLLIQQSNLTADQILSDAPWAVIAALTWILLTLINFSLVPMVALFEPNTPLSQALRRSHQLVRKNGRMFILGSLLLSLSLIGGLFIAGKWLERAANLDSSLLISGSAAVLASYHCLLTVLYRKRRFAR